MFNYSIFIYLFIQIKFGRIFHDPFLYEETKKNVLIKGNHVFIC